MSISTQLSRIQANRNTIRTKLVELGLATSVDTLDVLASAVDGMINNGAVSVEIKEGTSYTIPRGYHNGSGIVKAITDVEGEAEQYKVQAKVVTPTKTQQSITPDTGYYALESVTVEAIPDAYQDVTSVNVKADEVLVGKVFVAADGKVITGTMTNNVAKQTILSGTTITYTIPKGYHDGTGIVEIVLEEKAVTPTKAEQVITPSDGKVLSKVTVAPIPEKFVDTSDADALATEILAGKTAYVGTEKVEGTMANNPDVNKTLDTTAEGQTYTIPQGYHSGKGVVKVTTETKTVTPTKEEQKIGASAGKVISEVTVNPIPAAYQDVTAVDAESADIRSGKTIVSATGEKVTGTMKENDAATTVLDVTTNKQEYTIPEGYHSGAGKVQIVLEEKTATPTKAAQTITPATGKVLAKVNVEAIPAAYQDVTKVTATENDVLVGKTIVAKDGSVVNGTMANNGDQSSTIDGLTNMSVTIPAGYTTGGTISLTSDIEDALAAI